jgi:GTPase
MKRTFSLYFENGAIVIVDHVMQKPCGLVAVGEVKTGILSKGEAAAIKADDKEALYDEVKRIEIDYEEVESAEQGQQIGVCMESITKDDLVDYFRW